MYISGPGSSYAPYIAPPPPPPPPQTLQRPVSSQPYRLEPSYHPQLAGLTPRAAPSTSGASGPYSLPPGRSLGAVASGQQAQPFDVTLSKLATAVYGTRGGPPEGWAAVSDQDLQARGIQDPVAWRQQFLGDGAQTTAQEFKAEVYSDGNGSYVLSYRGTAEGAADWQNNFRQGTGLKTDPVDKFSGTAVNTAVEFDRVFGQGATADNLAITGHSQGGGLAAVGSLATGVPAVTFDASGIHPNTLDRMGFVGPQQARDIAEGGQIRAYSLHSDLLTQAQESGLSGLLAPDALGTNIVVEPGPLSSHTLFGRGAGVEFDGLSSTGQAALNALVEGARHSPLPLINAVGDLAYGAVSHNPNLLTAAMIEQQPWQPGYDNPTDFGKALHDLLPDTLKDAYARSTHDLVSDIVEVAGTDFRNGDYVRGGLRIAGDVAEGLSNATGDTLDTGIDGVGNLADKLADGAGDIVAGGFDVAGNAVEGLGNAGGDTLRGLGGLVGLKGLGDRAGTLVETTGRVLNMGSDAFGNGVDHGLDALGSVADTSIDLFGDGIENALDAAGAIVEGGADVAGTLAQGAVDGTEAVVGFLNPLD